MLVLQWGRKMDELLFQRLKENLPREIILEAGQEEENLARADVVILSGGPFGQREIELASRLKLLQLTWHYNPHVDLDYAAQEGIPVSGARFRHSVGVAEHTMLLLLALARRLLTGDKAVRDSKKYPPRWQGIEDLGFSFAYNWPHIGGLVHLDGKILGLLGLGSIGVEVARLAGAFGMRVLYWKKTPLAAIYERQLGVSYCGFRPLLQQSDFVSVHLGLNDETRGLIGGEELRVMKPTAYFINTARGSLIDENALCSALQHGAIAGAALDVYQQEPLPADSPLLSVQNLVMTPHYASGFDSYECSQRHIAETITGNIVRLLEGRRLVNVLNGVTAP